MSNDIVIAVITALSSSGVTGLITYLLQRHDKKKDAKNAKNSAQSQMVMGLGHDRIVALASDIIGRGYVTKDEYENLYKYLYKPYKALGGNGTAEKMIHEVNNLPMKTRRIEDEQN
jgi:hypothetical protein